MYYLLKCCCKQVYSIENGILITSVFIGTLFLLLTFLKYFLQMKDIAETRNIHKDIRTGEGNSCCQTASLNIYPKNM